VEAGGVGPATAGVPSSPSPSFLEMSCTGQEVLSNRRGGTRIAATFSLKKGTHSSPTWSLFSFRSTMHCVPTMTSRRHATLAMSHAPRVSFPHFNPAKTWRDYTCVPLFTWQPPHLPRAGLTWCRFKLSRPSRNSVLLLLSRTVIDVGKMVFPMRMGAMWTRPTTARRRPDIEGRSLLLFGAARPPKAGERRLLTEWCQASLQTRHVQLVEIAFPDNSRHQHAPLQGSSPSSASIRSSMFASLAGNREFLPPHNASVPAFPSQNGGYACRQTFAGTHAYGDALPKMTRQKTVVVNCQHRRCTRRAKAEDGPGIVGRVSAATCSGEVRIR